MADISAKVVKELREITGVGMMDCKKALVEAEGDFDKAIELLREKGLAAAAKKSSRIAAEGLVDIYYDEASNTTVVIEVNSETDFVAKNESFREFVRGCAVTAIKSGANTVEELLEAKFDGKDITVADELREKILVIGENMTVRRFEKYTGSVVTYIHGHGQIGVMVKFDTDAETAKKDEFVTMGKDVAMQIAAMAPSYLSKDEVPSEVMDKEAEIIKAQMATDPKFANKPAAAIDNIVKGKLNKYYEENCLLNQAFVKENKITVEQYVKNCAKEMGSDIKIVSFVKYEKGEGLEKRSDNFADEVAGMVK